VFQESVTITIQIARVLNTFSQVIRFKITAMSIVIYTPIKLYIPFNPWVYTVYQKHEENGLPFAAIISRSYIHTTHALPPKG
jgi:hypothetical protein